MGVHDGPEYAPWIVWMWFACNRTAHLAREPFAIKNECARFLGDRARECGLRLLALEQILAWRQIATDVMRKNLIALFRPQLSNATGPFADVSGCFA